MANRSYLYAISNNVGEEDKIIHGISECGYDIPLSYKILVSQDSKIVESIIWDENSAIAIQGDFNKGRQKLYDFLNRLTEYGIFEKSELAQQIAKTKEFLDSAEKASDIFHLENGELYDMNNEDLEAQNKAFFENEILKIDNTIEVAIARLRELKQSVIEKSAQRIGGLFAKRKEEERQLQINNILENMWFLLGISDWCEDLYYDFLGEEENEDKA